jgi:hypothetical protein
MNINEFERTKPVVTMTKINNIIDLIKNQQVIADSKDQQMFLAELHQKLLDMKNSFRQGD